MVRQALPMAYHRICEMVKCWHNSHHPSFAKVRLSQNLLKWLEMLHKWVLVFSRPRMVRILALREAHLDLDLRYSIDIQGFQWLADQATKAQAGMAHLKFPIVHLGRDM